jgi:hypothetical protein
MRTVVAAVMLTSVILPASVLADPSPASSPSLKSDVTKMVTDDCARARKAGKTCVLDVPAEDVDGQSPTAGDTGVRILIYGTQASLIRIRRDFIPEIVKTAEDL